jgi:S-sulfo-L-cysteine synthase (3-phospho-L-serine-dependent)
MPEQAFAFLESNTSGTGALFVQAAAALGLRPVLLASDPAYYPYVERDGVDAVRLDTQDREALLAACSRLRDGEGLAGIWSSSEYFIPAAASLARELGLPGPDPDAVASCRDKGVQRARLAAAGVGQPRFRIVRSAAEAVSAVSAAEALGLPVVVKPVLGTGSLGVRQCADAREVEAAAAEILARRVNERGMSLPERLLVEELAVGPEVSIETFDREVVGFTRKHLGEPPFFVEVGHDFPAPLPAAVERVLADTAIRALAALGLGWGPAHLEVKLTTGGPCLIEVNPRLAGGFIPELVRLATGLDSIGETVAAAAGRGSRLARKTRQAVSIRFLLAPGEGRLVAVEGLEEAAALEGVLDVRLYSEPGAKIFVRGDFRDRIGHVIACGRTPDESGLAAEAARDRLRAITSGF